MFGPKATTPNVAGIQKNGGRAHSVGSAALRQVHLTSPEGKSVGGKRLDVVEKPMGELSACVEWDRRMPGHTDSTRLFYALCNHLTKLSVPTLVRKNSNFIGSTIGSSRMHPTTPERPVSVS